MQKLPVSAVVVCCNEGYLLEDCLQSINFCQEIIVIDIGSSDNSLLIAKKYASRLLIHPPEKNVKVIQKSALAETSFEWVLFIDPDERIDGELAQSITKLFFNVKDTCASISVPWQFYFKNIRLKGTFWGQSSSRKILIINKSRNKLSLAVHKGIETIDTLFQDYEIVRVNNNVLHHLWMDSYQKLFQKHKNYLQLEGEAKYKMGWRYSRRRQVKHFFTAFYDSFIIYKGWKDGSVGLFLSLFYAWYNFSIWTSLEKYEMNFHKTSGLS